MNLTKKSSGVKWVYAAGVFDLLHYGHVRYLEAAKSLGDVLVVGLLTDEGTRRYKPDYPIMNYAERKEVIEALRCVNFIVPQDDTDPTATLKRINFEHGWTFDYMVRGDDYQGIPQGSEYIHENGGKVIRIPYCKEISSTRIKERIAEVNIR